MEEAARLAVAADSAAVSRLAATAVEELGAMRGGDIWRRREARRLAVADELGRLIDGEDVWSSVVVGTIDDVVVGYGVLEIEELHDERRLAVVRDLYVEPLARGVGVGDAMLDLLLDRARAAGAVGVDSLVLPGDRGTKNFFEAHGLTARAIVVHRSFDVDEVAGVDADVDGAA